MNKFMLSANMYLSEQGDDFTIISMDITNFKMLNSFWGYDFADVILMITAEKIITMLPENGFCARAFADLFILLYPGTDMAKVTEFVETLKESLQNLKIDTNVQLDVDLVMGIFAHKGSGLSVNLAINNANIARFLAKEQMKLYIVYDEKLQDKIQKKHQLEGSLRQGLINQELVIHYQPQVSLTDATVIGLEALVRWKHPTEGLISPIIFIPLAERNGLILSISKWVLDEVCKDIRTWMDKGIRVPTVAINVSKVEFYQPDFIKHKIDTVDEYGIPHDAIEFELTESAFTHDLALAIKMTAALKKAGFKIAMDDFGTGYSSLNYLNNIDIDKIKLDRSFLHNIKAGRKSQNIIIAIISLAKALNLKIVAEGAETVEEVHFMQEHHCDIIQGYYYYKPMHKKDIEKILLDSNDNNRLSTKFLPPIQDKDPLAIHHWTNQHLLEFVRAQANLFNEIHLISCHNKCHKVYNPDKDIFAEVPPNCIVSSISADDCSNCLYYKVLTDRRDLTHIECQQGKNICIMFMYLELHNEPFVLELKKYMD